MSDAPADSPSAPAAVTATPTDAPRRHSRHRRGRSAVGMVLQVVLIAVGVFLGLAGEEWREDRENRRLADETLRRFRAEVATNRDIVLEVKDYHVEKLAELDAYFTATEEEKANISVRLAGIRPPRFESTAWDLAVATGTLAYLDSELAFALSRIYGIQTMTTQLGNGMMDAMYLRTPTLDGDAFLAALRLYYDDLTDIEPGLLPAYDTLLVALDEALAE
jgi:hypothetical protein